MKIAFQGERGAYSENAIYTFFGEDVQVEPRKDLREVFESVTNQKSEFG
ncbi:prephenate dehydratase, partial [Candidatus Bathyarchaeota archaeon]|nr:prephenate dehydratase [Candidatus Bathyarchaeota archaeon]